MSEEQKSQSTGPEAELILTTKGNAFSSLDAVAQKRNKLRAEFPGKKYAIVPHGTGYALIETVLEPGASTDAASAGIPLDAGDSEYVRVRFHAKSNPNDANDIFVEARGSALLIQREVETIIPRSHMEAADATLRTIARNVPGENRKVVTRVKSLPYDYLGPATRKDYLALKEEGTRRMLAQASE